MASPRSSSRRPSELATSPSAGGARAAAAAPLLIGQSLELWRGPLAAAAAARNGAALEAAARAQLDAGARALDVNAGARDELAPELAWAAGALAVALPGVPLLLDCGDGRALAAALRAAAETAGGERGEVGAEADARRRSRLVANALRPGDAAAGALLDAAAASGAGLVLSPAELDGAARADPPPAEAVALLLRARERARAAGVGGPLFADALAYPPAADAARCARSLATLRALAAAGAREAGRATLVPLVAVGNVGHGAPAELRPALRRLYAAAALGAGARALLLPVEDRALVDVVGALAPLAAPMGRRATRPPGGTAPAAELPWLRRVARAASSGHPLPAPTARAGPRPDAAWDLLARA